MADKDKGLFTVLSLVLEELGPRRTYVDVLVRNRASQKGDIFFWEAAVIAVLKDPLFSRFKRLTWVSDTGPRTFRCCASFAIDADAQRVYPVILDKLFWPEHHGHNLCDAHIAVGAKLIERRLIEIEDARLKSSDQAAALLSPLSTADDIAKLLTEHCSGPDHLRGYKCIVLDDVNRDPSLKPPVRRVPGTMRLHEIHYESPTVLLVKELSSDPTPHRVHLHFTKPWQLLPGDRCMHVLIVLILFGLITQAFLVQPPRAAHQPRSHRLPWTSRPTKRAKSGLVLTALPLALPLLKPALPRSSGTLTLRPL